MFTATWPMQHAPDDTSIHHAPDDISRWTNFTWTTSILSYL